VSNENDRVALASITHAAALAVAQVCTKKYNFSIVAFAQALIYVYIYIYVYVRNENNTDRIRSQRVTLESITHAAALAVAQVYISKCILVAFAQALIYFGAG